MQSFTISGDLLMSFRAGTCATAKVCVVLDQHRNFLGCNVDTEVVSAAQPEHVLKSAS